MSTYETLAVIDQEHPWPGLMPFTENASAFFHGRDAETAELLRLIKRETLTTLFGQSGLGKSSLLHAGLFPRLRQDDYFPVYIRLDMAEGAADFAAQVQQTLQSNCRAHDIDAPQPSPGETLWHYFHRQDVDFWSPKNRLLTPVLVFDQFEEIFTLGGHAESLAQRCRAFLEELADLIEDRMPASLAQQIETQPELGTDLEYNKRNYKVVLSFREDYLPEFESLRTLIRPIMQNRMRLTRMSGDQALSAILQSGGHLVAPEIAEQIVRFVAAPRADRASSELVRLEVEPALMSVVCRELNNQRLSSGQSQITADQLREGAQQRIIQDFYTSSLQDVDARVRVFIEDQLLTDAGYRDSYALEDALAIPGITREVIDLLISRRLLRLEERSGVLRVELTHDVLTGVARASRDRRKQMEQEQAQRAQEAARKQRNRRLALIGGGLFSVAVGVAVVFGILLNKANEERKRLIETQSFIALSRANAALEQGVPGEPYALLAHALRLNPENHAALTRSVSLLAQRRFAQLQTTVTLATPAEIAWYDGKHSVLFGPQATLWYASQPAQAERLFLQTSQDDYEDFGLAYLRGETLAALRDFSFTAPGKNTPQQSLGYLPEAKLLPFVSRNRVLHFFDPLTRQRVGKPIQLPGDVRALAASPARQWVTVLTHNGHLLRARLDGNTPEALDLPDQQTLTDTPFAFITDQGMIVLRTEQSLWTIRAGSRVPQRLSANAELLRANTGGNLFAVVQRGEVQLFDAAANPLGKPLPHPGTVRDLSFSPDGRYLATACLDKQARLWDTQTQTLAGPPLKHHGAVLTVRFGDDAQTLATGSADGTLRIWQPFRGEPLVEPMIHPDAVAELALQPGGNQVLALTNGQEFYVWQWRHTAQPANLFQEKNSAAVLTTSADGTRLAYASAQGVARALHFDQNQKPLWESAATADAAKRLTFSPQSAVLAVALANATVQLRDGKTGQPLGTPLSHSHFIQEMRFSANGKLLATASRDGFVRLWDVQKQQLIGTRLEHRPGIQSLAFSPDSSLLLVAERTRVLLWDTQTLQSRGELDLSQEAGTRIVLADFNTAGDKLQIVDATRILHPALQRQADGIYRLPTLADAKRQAILLGDFKTWTATLSDDRRLLALGSLDGRMRIMQLDTLSFIGEIMHHDDAVLGLSFSPQGNALISWSRDRSVRIWDVRSGYAIADAVLTDSEPLTARLSQQADMVAIATDQGTGILQHIGHLPAPKAPSWLPDFLEAVGGTRFDQTGSSERLRNRAQGLQQLRLITQNESPAWRDWAKQVLSQLQQMPAATPAPPPRK